ncbi:MAG: hypothetical protein KGL39_25530, partial [Patescibacteria group bacterium]|nr:hypothetical protein [Patescibacteria group bacterium]
DMQRIAALSALVAQIQSGNLNTGAIGQLLGSMPPVTNPSTGGTTDLATALSQALAGGVANPSSPAAANVDLASQVEQAFSALYQNRASMGFGQYRAQNL